MPYILYVLLLANVGWLTAHANCSEHPQLTVLDNQHKIVTALQPSTVVRNWSLVCTYHCSATQAGVPCSCVCNGAAQNVPKTLRNRVFKNNKAIIDSDVLVVCGRTCSTHVDEKKISAMANLTSAEVIGIIDKEFGDILCRSLLEHKPKAKDYCSTCVNNFIEQRQATSSPSDETTPDWNDLCASLCKTGDGGALCNCNLSPFNF